MCHKVDVVMDNTERNDCKYTFVKGNTTDKVMKMNVWKSNIKLEKFICTKIIHKRHIHGQMYSYNKNPKSNLKDK